MATISADLNSVPRFTFRLHDDTWAGVDPNADLADPTTLIVTVTRPTGSSTTYAYGTDIEVVRDSVGVFHIDVTLDAMGQWTISTVAAGAVADSDLQVILVGTVHAYTDVVTFSAWLGPTASASAAQMQAAINAASRSIDEYCDRRFWLDPVAVARTYIPDGLYEVTVDDIGNTTDLAIAVDNDGDGVFEIVWSAGDYQLLPYNAPTASPEPEPWNCIRAVGSHTFPLIYAGSYLRRVDRVQVTARWGWPAVPDNVSQACLIKAARLFHRKNSPQGVIAFDEFGAVRLGRGEDSDVMQLLAAYRDDPILIA